MISNEILSDFVNKKVLITGGTGLIGREIAKILSDAGSDLRQARQQSCAGRPGIARHATGNGGRDLIALSVVGYDPKPDWESAAAEDEV